MALALPRSIEMIIALLGILKTGAAYLPLDPEYPAERLAYMLRDAGPACVLTTAQIAELLPSDFAQLLLDQPGTADAQAQSHSQSLTQRDAQRSAPLQPLQPLPTSSIRPVRAACPKPSSLPIDGIPSLAATQIEHFAVTSEQGFCNLLL